MKLIVFAFAMLFNMYPVKKPVVATHDGKFEVVKNNLYKGKDLEAVFRVTYIKISTKQKRFFEVIKTDFILKDYFLADYLMIERTGDKVKYYPLGWLGNKITETDIKYNCRSIIKGDVDPVNLGG